MAVNNNNNLNNNNTIDPDAKVVRIDADSAEHNLQALFDSVLQPAVNRRMPLQMPLRMRNLPVSFFKPPTTGSKSPSVSHSRENSADSAFGSGTTTICSPTGGINPVTSRLQISHSRAHSSPASLQQTYAGLSPQAAAAVAAAQQNANAANNNNNNSNTDGGGTTTGASGAISGGTAANTLGSSSSGGGGGVGGVGGANVSASVQRQAITPNHMKQRSYDVVSAIQLQEELGDLPPGWEQARTAEGQIYYLK